MSRSKSEKRKNLCRQRTAARRLQNRLLEPPPIGKRNVARAVYAAGDPAFDLAERDAVGKLQRRREAGAARALQVVGRRLRVEPASERALARQVPVARVLDHGTCGHLADPLAFQ